MKLPMGGKTAAVATVLALGGACVAAAQAPANASTVSESYSCSYSLGTENVTAQGSLTATPNPATAGSSVAFDLDITSTNFSAPVTINSWTATADIAGTGAENSAFTVSGSGGSIPSGQDVSNLNLTGSWTPSAAGTDSFTVGVVTLNANVSLFGDETVTCTPTGTVPTAETLTVNS